MVLSLGQRAKPPRRTNGIAPNRHSACNIAVLGPTVATFAAFFCWRSPFARDRRHSRACIVGYQGISNREPEQKKIEIKRAELLGKSSHFRLGPAPSGGRSFFKFDNFEHGLYYCVLVTIAFRSVDFAAILTGERFAHWNSAAQRK